jgi:hypothetical protein
LKMDEEIKKIKRDVKYRSAFLKKAERYLTSLLY